MMDLYYLFLAKRLSFPSPCLKEKVGAIITVNGFEITNGYNSPEKADEYCKICNRMDKIEGQGYEDCPSVHAEVNAIEQARRIIDLSLGYSKLYVSKKPCKTCQQFAFMAGIDEIIYQDKNGMNKLIGKEGL